ncbi:hypothetical protein YC2023_119378 [Brassica napus]
MTQNKKKRISDPSHRWNNTEIFLMTQNKKKRISDLTHLDCVTIELLHEDFYSS